MAQTQNTHIKIKAQTIYAPLFVLLLLLQLYLPSFKANIALQLAALLFFVFIERKTVLSIKFSAQVVTLILLLLLGFIGTILHEYEPFNIIKDIFHFIKPLVGILIGYLFFRKINNFRLFIQVVVVAGFISAIIHFYVLFFKVDFASGSISNIRYYTKDNFLELFAIFFLWFYKKLEGRSLINNSTYYKVVLITIVLSSILYFSRATMVMTAIMLLTIYGFTKITKQTILVGGAFIVALLLFYAYLNNTTIRRGKPGLEGFLYKIKVAPEEIFTTRVNRENHRDLWDHWRGYEAMRAYSLMEKNPSSYIVGTGHGSLVNLKFEAPLLNDPNKGVRYISELHNGYMYVFYKTGAIGLIIYLLLVLRWYAYVYKKRSMSTLMVSGIGAIYLFSTLTITGIYNTRDVIIFILGALLYYTSKTYIRESEKSNALP